jgi:hypothetical protein
MATFYNNTIKDVDTGEITVVTSSSDSTIVLSILATNKDPSANSDVTVILKEGATVNGFLASTIVVPVDSNVDILGNKYILPSGKSLVVSSSTSGTIDVHFSYVEV